MKFTSAIALIGVVSAINLEGHPNGDTSRNHWRKTWPEGVDNSDGDADVMNAYSLPKPEKKGGPKRETYPWEYDHDVIATGKSINGAEGSTGNKLTYDSVALKRGRDMVFENNKINTESAGDDDRLKEAPKKNPNYV
jgi:hypothetical protein